MNTLIVRADATREMGTGHVMRCLALAQAWQDKGGRGVFISRCESQALQQRLLAEGFEVFPLDKPYPDPGDWDFTRGLLDTLKGRDPEPSPWLVVDGYHFDAAYQTGVKAAGYKLLWIDDYGHAAPYCADLVLNQNIYAEPSAYIDREPYTQLLLGPHYALLRREFARWQGWRREIPALARKVLVTLGGADPGNVTLKAIQALKQVDVPGLEARIVIGPVNPQGELLQRATGGDPRLHLLTNVPDMPKLMAWAEVAIAAGGSTCWELAFMGLPSLLLVTAENQRANALALDRRGVGLNLGRRQDLSVKRITLQLKQLMVNSEERSLMAQRGQRLVDGYGGGRLRRIIAGETIKLRPVLSEDRERVWQWANDESVRAASFSEAFISWEEHIHWFQERIRRPYFYIALTQDDLPIGQVRFDQKEGETVISLMIDSAFRHRGYGAALIRTACEEIFSNTGINAIHAYVKPGNEASRVAFIRAGFTEMSNNLRQGYPAEHFVLVKG